MKSGFDARNIDRAVRPQDDFFQFAAGGWLKKNPIPKTESRWGSFYVLRDRSWKAIGAILQRISTRRAKPGTELQKLRDFYRTAMDEEARERQGVRPLKKYLERIDAVSSPEDLFRVLGEMHQIGLYPFWTPFVDQDDKRSEDTILHLWQGGLILPDREYYLGRDKKSQEIRKQYMRYIARMLSGAGHSPAAARKAASVTLGVETALARISRSRTALREVERQYHKMTISALKKTAPHVPWAIYFHALGAPRMRTLIVGQPEFFRAASIMAAGVPLERLRIYLGWFLLNGAAGFLSKKFAGERFRFHGTVLSGTAKMKPLWKRVAMAMDSAMGEALGKLYVREYFSARAKKEMDVLVDNIVHAYAARIRRIDWMSPKTKRRALQKLAAIRRKLAYPKRWRSYRALAVRTDSYLENFFRAERFEQHRLLAKIGKPLDRDEWFMTPPTVNAYYARSLNEIVFPAGILQPPFFDPDAFAAVNYAAIGSVVGHELTHGFDDQGSKFDAKGNMREWWSPRDRQKFTRKTGLLVKQFSQYPVAGGIPVNGKLTLGENIADLGGLVIAYDAFKNSIQGRRLPKTIGGWTPDQLFFLGFAQAEMGHARPEEERRLAAIDPHAPPRYRANGTLSNIGEFYKAFGIKPGDKMFRRPGERAKIW